MDAKPFIRYVDAAVVFVSLDVLQFALSLLFLALFGAGENNPVTSTLVVMLSLVMFWMRLGLAVLFFKRIPFRSSKPESSVALLKIWAMTLFWPLVFTK